LCFCLSRLSKFSCIRNDVSLILPRSCPDTPSNTPHQVWVKSRSLLKELPFAYQEHALPLTSRGRLAIEPPNGSTPVRRCNKWTNHSPPPNNPFNSCRQIESSLERMNPAPQIHAARMSPPPPLQIHAAKLRAAWRGGTPAPFPFKSMPRNEHPPLPAHSCRQNDPPPFKFMPP
jgi:hypothetical protein